MKRPIVIGVSALAVLGLAFLMRGFRADGAAGPRASDARPPVVPSEAASFAETLPVPAEVAARAPTLQAGERDPRLAIAERLSLLFTSIRERVNSRQGKGIPYSDAELSEVMALEREAGRLGLELKRSLEENPRGSDSLIDWILGLEDETTALRITGQVAGAFDVAAGERMAAVLRGSSFPRERRIAALALSMDTGQASLLNLLAASRADADAGVRRASLESVAARMPQPESRGDLPLIRQIAGTLAAGDPDERVRGTAASIARRLDASSQGPDVSLRARFGR